MTNETFSPLFARLEEAAPALYAALWLLLGDEETAQTACMFEDEKRDIARAVLARAASPDDCEKILNMVTWVVSGDDPE
jgi:hypothetical protein